MPEARVLLVEDEANLAKGIEFNLGLEGYEVQLVDDGLRALDILTGPPAHDLVVLDVMLPGMDGFSLARRMRDAGNYTPLLMLTAKSLPEDVVQGLGAGADDYLAKPFDLAVLLARVKGLLRRRDWTRGEDGPRSSPEGFEGRVHAACPAPSPKRRCGVGATLTALPPAHGPG